MKIKLIPIAVVLFTLASCNKNKDSQEESLKTKVEVENISNSDTLKIDSDSVLPSHKITVEGSNQESAKRLEENINKNKDFQKDAEAAKKIAEELKAEKKKNRGDLRNISRK